MPGVPDPEVDVVVEVGCVVDEVDVLVVDVPVEAVCVVVVPG